MAIFALSSACLIVYWLIFSNEDTSGISVIPPEVYQDKPIRLIDSSNYLQNDPRWGKQLLGNTAETLGKVGCTLSSVAMALKNMGHEFNPETLNRRVRDINGYTESGWFKWASVEHVTDSQAYAVYYTEPSHKIINHCLRRGQYPIVKFRLPNLISHWVIITGRSSTEYLVRDPLVTSIESFPLSSRAKRILSVRCIADRWFYHP